MENVYHNYLRDFYKKSSGYIPNIPLGENVYPGDLFQIRNQEIIPLGNIFYNQLVLPENCMISDPVQLNSAGWNFSQGKSIAYSGRGSGENPLDGEFNFSRQIIHFDEHGSYFFKAEKPELVSIENWNEIKDSLIIKLTQTHFSFREIYVVTEAVTAESWTLAISNKHKAELEIATEQDSFGLLELFGLRNSKTIQSKDLEYYNQVVKRKPNFFKAKKLSVQDEPLHEFISNLINQRMGVYEWANHFFDYNFEYESNNYPAQVSRNAGACMLDMLGSGELTPNTALRYFRWVDTSLNDVDLLFNAYE